MIWADDSVISEWAEFRTFSPEGKSGVDLLIKYESIMLSIRKDLGHKNNKLDNHELLKCFLNGVEEAIAKSKIKES